MSKIRWIDLLTKGLNDEIAAARTAGHSFIDIKAGDLHKKVIGNPSQVNRMPICCNAMYNKTNLRYDILNAPPKGKGPKLLIRYYLE